MKQKKILVKNGFSIIEILVVVAIIAVLLLIIVPNFSNQSLKSNRQDAFNALTNSAQELERFYAANQTYSGFALNSTTSSNGNYNIALNTGTMAYTLTATAVGTQANDTIRSLRINQAGATQHSLASAPNDFLFGWKE